MKFTSLLFSALVGSLAASAQLQQPTTVHLPADGSRASAPVKSASAELQASPRHASGTAAKTTAAMARWYSWVDYFDTTEQENTSSIAFSLPYMWKDTLSMDAYSATGGGTTYQHNRTVSMGSILDPSFSGFNNFNYYNGEMKVTATNSYALDSVIIFGHYGINPAKTAVKDTLRVVILTGNGGSSSDIFQAVTTNSLVTTRYGFSAGDSMKYYNIHFDSTLTRSVGTTALVKDIIIDNTMWGDTTSTGVYYFKVGFPAIAVPAGGMVSASYTFISGDASFVPHDTVFSSTMGYKYNMLRPYVAYRGTTSAPEFANYSVSNRNTGVFKTLPNSSNGWTDRFIPLWFWSSGSSGSTLQYPYIDYHITCTTCGTIYDPTSVTTVARGAKVSAYPSPADDMLHITFNASASGNAEVTLTNVTGQVVGSKVIATHAGQDAATTFAVAGLPGGLYLYSVKADGQLMTGKVMIGH